MALSLALGWATTSYLYIVNRKRFDISKDIETLPDPSQDLDAAQYIHELMWDREFPFLGRMVGVMCFIWLVVGGWFGT
jgi:hypothetical protein